MYKVDRVHASWQRDDTVPEFKAASHSPHKAEWRKARNRERATPEQLAHLDKVRAMMEAWK